MEETLISRMGYAPGSFDRFHIGHLNLLRKAKDQCDFLIAGIASDELLIVLKGIVPVIPFAERLEIVRSIRFVDAAFPAMKNDKLEIWRELRFDVLFKGDDWRGTEKDDRLERDFAAVGVDVVYFPYTRSTSSSTLRRKLRSIDAMTDGVGSISRYPAQLTRGAADNCECMRFIIGSCVKRRVRELNRKNRSSF
jgi:glycerol-3-phosphate cytidylyltransferase